jgi:putative hydrolase of the HAD superfamily
MRAFLFDLDDTLFDHAHSTRVALRAIREHVPALAAIPVDVLEAQHALVLEEVHLQVLAGAMDVDSARIRRFHRLVEMHGGRAGPEEIEAGARAYRAAYLAARRAVSGAVPLLQALHPYGRIGVVSNNVRTEQQEKMVACGLRDHVDVLVVSEEIGTAKPDPAIFLVALERLKVRADDAVMFGDSWSADVIGARAAGIRPVWFNPRRRPRPDDLALFAELDAWEPTAATVEGILAIEKGKG